MRGPAVPAPSARHSIRPSSGAPIASSMKIVRHEPTWPSQAASGVPSTMASVMPAKMVASALAWREGSTRAAPWAEAAGPMAAAPSAISTRAARPALQSGAMTVARAPRPSSSRPPLISSRRGR